MPLLESVMKALKLTGNPMPAVAPHAHDGDEIFLADSDTRKRDRDLAILRTLCS
jgi:hypothetical protein